MASNFSQVNLTENDDTGDWDFVAKHTTKRKRHTTNASSVPPSEDFENANNNTKLSMIFEEILNLKVDQASTRELISVTNQYMKIACGKINSISSVTNQLSVLLKTPSYKSIDSEARSRRNNLIFRGIKESCYEKCSDLVFEFIAHTLQIDMTGIVITLAHRLGLLKIGQRFNRPIIVNFMNYHDVEHIMANAKTLKHCPGYSIDRDVPKEIVDARKCMWGLYKDTKKDNPGSSIRIVYPVKLMCGNRVVRDEFPDWHTVLNKSRITTFPVLETFTDEDMRMDTDNVLTPMTVTSDRTYENFLSPTVPDLPHSSREANTSTDVAIDLSQPSNGAGGKIPSLFHDVNKAETLKPCDTPNQLQNNPLSETMPKVKATTRSPRSATRRQLSQRRVQSVSVQRDSHACNRQPVNDNGTNPVPSERTSTLAEIDSG